MWIDSHCHLDAPEFDADRDAVAARARACGVATIVLPAVEPGNFDAVRDLAHRHDGAYALGIHPLFVDRAGADAVARLRAALQQRRDDPRLVAVGEIGLDHFVPGIDRQRQQETYLAQLRLAREFELPVILHVRRSADALLAGLRRLPVAGGIAHAFNGSVQQARMFVELGFSLGFGGAFTFDRALQIRRLAAELPLEAIVLETDAPDIPPQWLYRTAEERRRGATMRNEPGELPRIAAALAALRGIGMEALAAASSAACGPAASAAAPVSERLVGLAPVLARNTRLVVLGSFPSEASLASRQYYAHPRNHFWPILAALWGVDLVAQPYAGRIAGARERGLGIWDVYAGCRREGSLDSAIGEAQLNDLASLRRRAPGLRAVAHNGGESARHMRITAALGVPVWRLPSTSPANASWSFERKLAAWREVFVAAGIA